MEEHLFFFAFYSWTPLAVRSFFLKKNQSTSKLAKKKPGRFHGQYLLRSQSSECRSDLSVGCCSGVVVVYRLRKSTGQRRRKVPHRIDHSTALIALLCVQTRRHPSCRYFFQSPKRPRDRVYCPLCVQTLYFLDTLFYVLNHEMWRLSQIKPVSLLPELIWKDLLTYLCKFPR